MSYFLLGFLFKQELLLDFNDFAAVIVAAMRAGLVRQLFLSAI
jgi:hypothetical protein